MIRRVLVTLFFWSGAITMLVMSIQYFQNYIIGIIQGKSVTHELWYHIMVRVHIVFGMVAMFVAPTQFLKSVRQRSLTWHRRLGYVYILAVFLSALCGLIIAQFVMGGLMSRLGFTILSILWVSFTYKGISAILKKNVVGHQIWMTRSFALTFSAIPLRLMLLIPLFFDVKFITIYKLASWLCWIITLTIAELVLRRKKVVNTI